MAGADRHPGVCASGGTIQLRVRKSTPPQLRQLAPSTLTHRKVSFLSGQLLERAGTLLCVQVAGPILTSISISIGTPHFRQGDTSNLICHPWGSEID